jgi:hypothetical protein
MMRSKWNLTIENNPIAKKYKITIVGMLGRKVSFMIHS